MDAILKEINAGQCAWIEEMKAWQKEMKAGREATEAYPEKMEANPEEIKSVAVHQEVPKEESAMETFGTLKKRHGDRHLAGRRGGPKQRTRGNGGSRKKLAASQGRLTRRAGVTRRKGRGHNGPTAEQRRRKKQARNSVVQVIRKGRTFRKRRRGKPECNHCIRTET
jgi:hypothetical protein